MIPSKRMENISILFILRKNSSAHPYKVAKGLRGKTHGCLTGQTDFVNHSLLGWQKQWDSFLARPAMVPESLEENGRRAGMEKRKPKSSGRGQRLEGWEDRRIPGRLG